MTRRIAVVSGGLSSPSSSRVLADQLSLAVRRALTERGERVDFDVIELRELAHPLVDNLLTGFPSPEVKRAVDSVTEAEGLIAVTPIFAASYSALFKAFFDVIDKDALIGLPVLIGASGGTERHSLALDHAIRPLFGYLRALVVPTGVYAASTDFGAAGGDSAGLGARIDRAGHELADLVTTLPPRRRVDPFDLAVPFEQLLPRRD